MNELASALRGLVSAVAMDLRHANDEDNEASWRCLEAVKVAMEKAEKALIEHDTGVKWVQDEYGTWTCTGCNSEWVYDEGTPEENGVKFCNSCGCPIISYIEFRYDSHDVYGPGGFYDMGAR